MSKKRKKTTTIATAHSDAHSGIRGMSASGYIWDEIGPPEDGNMQFNADGSVKFFHGKAWTDLTGKASTSNLTSAVNGATDAMVSFGRAMSGLTPEIFRREFQLEYIDKEEMVNREALEKITKTDQVKLQDLPDHVTFMIHKGGMVTTKMQNGSYRRLTMAPGELELFKFYDGKKKGVIGCFQIMDEKSRASLSIKGQADSVEIPLKEFDQHFSDASIETLLRHVMPSQEAPQPSLLSKESTVGLIDFGVF